MRFAKGVGLFAIGFLALSAPAMAVPILSPGSTWEYTFTDPTGSATWNTTTGGWATGAAPFGNDIGTNPDFNFVTPWAADGADGDDLWVRTTFDTTGFILSTIAWDLGVDNGYKLYLNGTLINQANAEGYTFRWEYSGTFGAALIPGVNVLAVALEDHGGLTAFDMQVTGDPVPEPGTLLLLGSGVTALALRRRRKA